MNRAVFFILLLGWAVDSAEAIVTSDEFGSHVVTPGETSFGVNTDGVVMVGGLRDSGEPVSGCSGALITESMNGDAVRLLQTWMPRFRNTDGLIIDLRVQLLLSF